MRTPRSQPPSAPSAPAPALAPAPPVVPTAQEVFAEHAPFVLRSVRRLGVRESEVEDVAQEVFVIVHRKLATWNGTSTLRTWLFGIALRVASAHRRKAYVRRELLDNDAAGRQRSVPPEQQDALRRKELRAQLDRALELLDENKRAVFVLYELEGVPMTEIAEGLGCALFTAYGRLREAREQVRACFERMERVTP
jgi:RNA polymerase sigma-70 factor (ECF subfamily)